jgi:uncharacterized protein YbjT (DUF2867 family)
VTTNLILVTGATGQQGSAVANARLQKEKNVRVMTRNPEKAAILAKAGAEVVKGNLTDQTDLQEALRGVQGVFAMSTPFEAGMEEEVRQWVMLADAAKQAGVSHYVYTSVGSAHRHTGIPHFESKWKVEQHIEKVGLPATILRPVFFMENFTTFSKPSPEGVLTMPMRPDRRLAMVALRDIGEFGTEAFVRPNDFLGQAIDLAGDELTILKRQRSSRKRPDDRSGSRSSHWTERKPLWGTILPRCFVGSMKSGTPSTFPR